MDSVAYYSLGQLMAEITEWIFLFVSVLIQAMEQALEYGRNLDIAVSWLLMALLVASIACYIYYYFTWAICTPRLFYNKNKTNENILSRCSLLYQQYTPSFLLWTRVSINFFSYFRPSEMFQM